MYYGGWGSDYLDPNDWHNVIFEGDYWQSHYSDPTYLDMIKKANTEPVRQGTGQMQTMPGAQPTWPTNAPPAPGPWAGPQR